MPRMVWTEIGDAGLPIRIFKNRKQAVIAGCPFGGACMLRAIAVESIRRQIWERAKHTCEHCGQTVAWGIFQMHEFIWRGRGGDVSIENGRCLCSDCHQNDPVAGHGKRKVQWSR